RTDLRGDKGGYDQTEAYTAQPLYRVLLGRAVDGLLTMEVRAVAEAAAVVAVGMAVGVVGTRGSVDRRVRCFGGSYFSSV
uniref:hypothetical protein n=1 Tax=Streptomyces caniscabiei TaxID=2746961 RepID=UPI0015C51C6F